VLPSSLDCRAATYRRSPTVRPRLLFWIRDAVCSTYRSEFAPPPPPPPPPGDARLPLEPPELHQHDPRLRFRTRLLWPFPLFFFLSRVVRFSPHVRQAPPPPSTGPTCQPRCYLVHTSVSSFLACFVSLIEAGDVLFRCAPTSAPFWEDDVAASEFAPRVFFCCYDPRLVHTRPSPLHLPGEDLCEDFSFWWPVASLLCFWCSRRVLWLQFMPSIVPEAQAQLCR